MYFFTTDKALQLQSFFLCINITSLSNSMVRVHTRLKCLLPFILSDSKSFARGFQFYFNHLLFFS